MFKTKDKSCSVFLINMRTGGVENLLTISLQYSVDFGGYHVSPLPGWSLLD